MGFFNKILKGLGFDDGDDEEKVQAPKKEKKVKQKNTNSFGSFNLNDDEPELEEKAESKPKQTEEEKDDEVLGLKVMHVSSQTDVQNVVKRVKNGARVIVYLEKLSQADIVRSLDFLTGAVFALGLTIQKVENNIYVIQ